MVFEATGFDPYFPSWICLSILTVGFLGDSDSKESACNVGDLGLIPRLGRSPREGNGNPLHDSSLENPMDREAWQATAHGVTKSCTRLSDWTDLTWMDEVWLMFQNFTHKLACFMNINIKTIGVIYKEMATHSSILPWKIPWTEKPGRLRSIGSQRVGHAEVT